MNFAIEELVQDCNLNFLIGSGLSSPYLRTLGQIETLLTQLDQSGADESEKKIVRCSLYRAYFAGVMLKNCKLLKGDPDAKAILANYYDFLKVIAEILLKRKSSILGKEANLFTTNIDVFLERAVEQVGLECNDGFSGRFEPWFDLSNFNKSHFKRSPQYDNRSELPTLNLLKLHGSLTWKWRDVGPKEIVFCPDLSHVEEIESKALKLTQGLLLDVNESSTFQGLRSDSHSRKPDATVEAFLEAYDALPIVNPTKTKFQQTILNQTHYELLRIYSNELEKENTVLFVFGFSFADEHIREITVRAANSNPTLMVYIYAYDQKSAADISARFPPEGIRNSNIEILKPETDERGADKFNYDFAKINKSVLHDIIQNVRSGT